MLAKHKKARYFLDKGLYTGLATFSELEKRISNLPEVERGDAFEVFAEAYLNTQKIVQAKNVWPDKEIPQSLRTTLALPPADMGVDGVVEVVDGNYNSYQVKFRSERASLCWAEISTFMGLSDHVHLRVLFTNTDSLPTVLDDRSDFYAITGNDLDRLEERDFKAIEEWLKTGKASHIKKNPRPHQEHALRDLNAALDTEDRTTAVMACASGKTLIALWLAEKRDVRSVLVLLPSLALIRQTLHEWIKETAWHDIAFLCICSDPTVTQMNDSIVVHQADCDFPVTTKTEEVARFLQQNAGRRTIIFSTYQSCKMLPADCAFDLGIFDEAHKTAGREGTNFSFALKDENVSIKKRLFLTATPRHYDVNKKDKEGEFKLVCSMDDTAVYGEISHKLSFVEAAKQKIICPYKVIISLVVSDEINRAPKVDRSLLKHGEVVVEDDVIKAQRVANLLALTNAVERYGAKKIFTFHSSVEAAHSFAVDPSAGIMSFLKNFSAFHVNGQMVTSKRESFMKEFREVPQALMSNVRCLSEGVDVPAVDMVAFISPKKSKVDIVQAAGRAMRNAEGKECGYVLIPLFLEVTDNESLEQALEKTKFDEIWHVLQAMQEHDEDLVEIIRSMREELGGTGGFNDSRLRERLEFLGPVVELDVLRNAITTKIVEQLSVTWDERFGQLLKFKEENGHCNVPQNYSQNFTLGSWVSTQRVNCKNGRLSKDREKRLESIGFDWDPLDTTWENMFAALCEFREERGHCKVPNRFPEKPELGAWVGIQRGIYGRGELLEARKEKLEAIGFDWDPFTTLWENMFSALCKYYEEYGHCNVPKRNPVYRELGTWVGAQRNIYKKRKLPMERISRLEAIGFDWDVLATSWEKLFIALCDYRKKQGHCNVQRTSSENTIFGQWLSVQRRMYKQGELSKERIDKLESIQFEWDICDGLWEKMFTVLCQYSQKNGHCNVPLRFLENPTLGNWVIRQRMSFAKNKLSSYQKNKLEAIGFEWDLLATQWETKFASLCEYCERNGHCIIPKKHPVLRMWVGVQRKAHKEGKLSKERRERLEAIGLDFDPYTNLWEIMFTALCEYREEYGNCIVPRYYSQNLALGNWVKRQRMNYKKGNLPKERIERLESIGFVWSIS